LNRYDIHAYLLFIRKDSQFIMATQKGYVSSDVDSLKFNDENLIIDYLKSSDSIQTISELELYYREAVFIPKEMNLTLKMEKELLRSLKITNLVPFFNESNNLFGFLIFDGNYTYDNHSVQIEFYNALKSWALTYYTLHIENQSRKELKTFKKYVQFTKQLAESDSIDEASEHVLDYFLDVMHATKGILYVLNKGYYTPLKFRGIGFIRSHPKKTIQAMQRLPYINMKTAKDTLFDELGKGRAQMFQINNRYLVVVKHLFRINVDESMLKTVQKLTGRIFKCLDKK